MHFFCLTADDQPLIPPLPNSKKYINFTLTPEEWQVITLCRDVLKVTATRNAILGKEDTATSHWVIPAMHEVKEEWENFLEDPTYEIIAPAIQAGLNNMYKWYRKVTEDTPVYFICHVLDPRRRLAFLEAAWEPALLEKGLKLMRNVFLLYKSKIQVESPSPTSKKAVQPLTSYSSADSYMDQFIAKKQKQKAGELSSQSSLPVSQYQELEKYLEGVYLYIIYIHGF
ncbi:hypothetical protein K435DRAFT_423995 [Dendrothele bispora CBS 962.96]|uniref:hAT-like transposase RNase-H fold domain-containing protein n=1 Tax=Dendrothele bispora (strain CBS 962.96) TaxID=1314807 RepID=A0A4V4HCK0_DENBC|nr:hypothetical protein K435DRAFT_423995 [Dendrothele bispora CBS 962.96]